MNKIIGTIVAIIVLLILIAATPSWQKPKNIVVRYKETRDTVAVFRDVRSVLEPNDSLIIVPVKGKRKVFYPKDRYVWVFKFDNY